MAADGVVHIIDDDDAVRESISFLLGAARIPVQTHQTASAFLRELPALSPGCIVTDIRMPELSGMDLLKRLSEGGDKIPVIMMTGHGDVPLAVEAMKLGAADFIEKPFEDERLLGAVRLALSGRRDTGRGEIAKLIALLSERERQVLEELVAGRPNKVIAFDLGISARTVEVYRANVMTKMHAGSLADLVRMSLLVGISPITDGK
jgi:two-component system response regulator FixJ